MNRITIQVCSKDRHSELGLLLQSLRTQTFQDWDIIIGDESSTPIASCNFLIMLINRLKHEGHGVELIRHGTSQGVCFIRNVLIKKNPWIKNKYSARLDDDVILESNYLEKMVYGLKLGYDIMSGVTPTLNTPLWKRENKRVKPLINDIKIDSKGNITKYTDDCGIGYIDSDIIPATNFRSNAVYKTKVTNDNIKYPNNLTKVGFREEAFFSFSAILKGYKIGVDTGAIAWHLQSPSGGCRTPDYSECVQIDEQTFRKWVKRLYKKHGDFIKKYKLNKFGIKRKFNFSKDYTTTSNLYLGGILKCK